MKKIFIEDLLQDEDDYAEDGVEEVEREKEFDRWVKEGDKYFPCGKTVQRLPAGYYKISYSQAGYFCTHNSSITKDKVINLLDDFYKNIVDDIKSFWENEQAFKDFKYTYKRGLLLYGPQGTGKTYLLYQICDYLIKKYDGIIIQADNLINLTEFLPQVLSKIESNRKIIVLLEDLDKLIEGKETSGLLSLLDGQLSVNNVVYIATTNVLDAIDKNLKDRPSRFDRKHLVDLPTDNARKLFIENKIPASHLEKIDLDLWVKKTINFSFAHIKELIISVLILGNDFEESVKTLSNMKLNNQQKIGF